MSARKSILMMTNTGDGENAYTVYGKPVRADSYYGHTDGIHTIQVIYNNFTGGFGVQGTLALEPVDEDWFWIQLNYVNGTFIGEPYITYPRNPLAPTGSNSQSTQNVGDTGTNAFTFVGNFTYLRAVLYRDYITPTPTLNDGRWYLGQLDKVLLSL